MLKRRLFRLIGLLFFVYVLSRLDWSRLWSILKEGQLVWLGAAFLANLPQLWLKATRWRMLLEHQGLHVTRRKTFLYYMSAVFMGVVTPGRLGELAKAVYLRQDGVTSLAHGFSSVVMDRLCDLYLLCLLGTFGITVLDPWKSSSLIGWGGFLMVLLVGGAGYYVLKGEGRFYGKYVAPRLPEPVREHLQEFNRGLVLLLGKVLPAAFFLTICSYAIYFFQCYLVAKAFSLPVTYWMLVPIMALTNIFSFLPISISGLGTREAALLFLLRPRGIPVEVIIAFSLGILVVFFIGGGLLGFAAWWMEPVGFKTVASER